MANFILDYTSRPNAVQINLATGTIFGGITGPTASLAGEVAAMGQTPPPGGFEPGDTFTILGSIFGDTVTPANGYWNFTFNGQGGADLVAGFAAPQSQFYIIVESGDLPASGYTLQSSTSEGDFFPDFLELRDAGTFDFRLNFTVGIENLIFANDGAAKTAIFRSFRFDTDNPTYWSVTGSNGVDTLHLDVGDTAPYGTETLTAEFFAWSANDVVRITGSGNADDITWGAVSGDTSTPSALIEAGDGTDTIRTGAFHNYVDGGDGTDTVMLTGDIEDYEFTANPGGGYALRIADQRGGAPDGVDDLINVENIQFDTAGTFSVASILDGPVATDDVGLYTPTDIIQDIDVLDNDADPNGDEIRIVGTSSATGGTPYIFFSESLNHDAISFEPDSGFIGVASFNYEIADPFGNTDTASVRIAVGPRAPETITLNWKDGVSNIDSASSIIGVSFDANADVVTEFLPIGSITSTATNVIATNGGPAAYYAYDNFHIIGTPLDLTGTYIFIGDTIQTLDGDDIIEPNGGRDGVSTGGGNDIIIVTTNFVTGAGYQTFFGNVFDGGPGYDLLEVSGAEATIGGLNGLGNGIEDRALVGIEELRFTPGLDPYNSAYGRWIDFAVVDGIGLVRGSTLSDTLNLGAEPGHTYTDGNVVDLSGLNFADWGPDDHVQVEGSEAGDVFTAIDTPIGSVARYATRGGNDIFDAGTGYLEVFAGTGNDAIRIGTGELILDGDEGFFPSTNPGLDTDLLVLNGAFAAYAIAVTIGLSSPTDVTVEIANNGSVSSLTDGSAFARGIEIFEFQETSGAVRYYVPLITSNGGGDEAAITLEAGQTAVSTVTASDLDSPSVEYGILGGAHAALFDLNAVTGQLSFIDASVEGTYSVIVGSSDGLLRDVQAITVTVEPGNEPPVVADLQQFSGDEDTSINGVLAASDVDSTTLTFALVSGPTQGDLTLGNDGSFLYEPDENSNGVYSFTYSVNDGDGAEVTRTAGITVNPVNDAPVNTVPGPQTAIVGTPKTFTFGNAISVGDIDSLSITVSLVASAGALSAPGATGNGTGGSPLVIAGSIASVNAALGALVYTTTVAGAQTITMVTDDGAGGIDTDIIALTVANGGGVTIIGTSGADTINATTTVAGQPLPTEFGDTIDGKAGNDTISGLGGNDILTGGRGTDVLNGDDGDDTFYFNISEGADTINGGADFDQLFISGDYAGVVRNDVLKVDFDGGDITAVLSGAVSNIENITVDLGGGTNGLTYTAASTVAVIVDLAAGMASGFASIANIANVTGGSGADTITGNSGANVLNGGTGNDVLTGGGGNDTMNGGGGTDTFIFDDGFGNDTIFAFDANPSGGQDRLDISLLGIDLGSFGTRVLIEDLGNDTLVTIDGTDTITLTGVSGTGANVITVADFLLFA